ncbi:Trm112 family protein [Acidicapsa acidisoli]|uniref:Trm112 family protein n=1 Tax=Acidicapsa acidisoli TaxID=1615681 RepID=UPI0037C06B20
MPVPHRSHEQSREFNGHGFDSLTLEQLVCPVCFGALRLDLRDSRIHCVDCKRGYPLIDGIPVLIPERAVCREMPDSDRDNYCRA